MSRYDAGLTLRQIVEVCDKAIEFRTSMTWEEFRGDWRKQMLGEREEAMAKIWRQKYKNQKFFASIFLPAVLLLGKNGGG
jgi:hypothetical protein